MQKEKLQEELDLILANRLVNGYLDYSRCIDWAIRLMDHNLKSVYIDIIAGLDIKDTYSIELYFARLIDDLCLEQDREDEYLFNIYILDIAQRVVARQLMPTEGLYLLDHLNCKSLDFNFSTQIIHQFTCLAEDISLLGDSYQLWYEGLTNDNKEEVIVREMQLLILAVNRGLDKVTNLIYCKKCNRFSYEKYINRRVWQISGRWICQKCGSIDFLAWSKVCDQNQIIKLLEK